LGIAGDSSAGPQIRPQTSTESTEKKLDLLNNVLKLYSFICGDILFFVPFYSSFVPFYTAFVPFYTSLKTAEFVICPLYPP
jgi:hypothetical protein